jgi:hypothetical protein
MSNNRPIVMTNMSINMRLYNFNAVMNAYDANMESGNWRVRCYSRAVEAGIVFG